MRRNPQMHYELISGYTASETDTRYTAKVAAFAREASLDEMNLTSGYYGEICWFGAGITIGISRRQ
jgi:hypothetical protein